MSAALDEPASTGASSSRRQDGKTSDAVLAAAVARLSGPQRDCLRLALEYKSSKEIARLLSMTPHSVDWHMKAAMRKLGVESRIAAALVLRDHVGTTEQRQPLARQVPELVPAPSTIKVNASINEWSDRDASTSRDWFSDGDVPAGAFPHFVVPEHAIHGPSQLAGLVSVPWGARNTLGLRQRLIAILLIAGFATLFFGATIASLAALRTLL